MCHLPEAGVLFDAMCASNGGPFTDIHDLYLHSMVPMAWMRGGEDAREDPPSSSSAAAPTAHNTSSEGKKKQQVEKEDSSEEKKKKKDFSKESPPGADFTEHLKHDMRTDADKSAARDAITSSPPNPRASARADGHRTYRVPQSALHTGDSPPKYGYVRKFTLNSESLLRLPFPNPY